MPTLADSEVRALLSRLPREAAPVVPRRQPIHTVYGGAHLFKSETPRKLGDLARKALDQYAPDAQTFAQAISLPEGIAQPVYDRVREKLGREPVEDFRIDFEDGYGIRPDSEEDAHAVQAALQLAQGVECPFIGVRIKAMSERALRTLDLFLTAVGGLPPGFVVTLPKVSHPAQLSALADALEALEDKLGLPLIPIEAMIELPQNILDGEGVSMLPALRAAARGRLRGAHFGAYDYTAALGVTAAHQSMQHPACDFARQMMLHAFSGTEVMVSDGATTVMPVPRHRKDALTDQQLRENVRDVHTAWRLHADDVRHSLRCGIYQGWDLHPAQLPSRYGAAYGFFLEALPAATDRLKNFVARAAQATLHGAVFDDAATGQGLLNFFVRGLVCGALTEAEVLDTGVSLDELQSASFAKILANRRTT
ncbi:MAG TPA: aldolase/citrate lyase family protein [Myxococcales bacterium]|jgi:citrate lyase beta subunit